MPMTVTVGVAKVVSKIILLIRILVNFDLCFWAKNGDIYVVVLTNINPLVVEEGLLRQVRQDETRKQGVKSSEKFVKVEKNRP